MQRMSWVSRRPMHAAPMCMIVHGLMHDTCVMNDPRSCMQLLEENYTYIKTIVDQQNLGRLPQMQE